MAAGWVSPSPSPPLPPTPANMLRRVPARSLSLPASRARRRKPSPAAASPGPPPPGSDPPRRPPPSPLQEASSSTATGNNRLLPQEDVDYLWKATVGSVAGGAAIKYGSAVFPEMTRPSLSQALLMIGLPVLVSVFLLVWGSSSREVN
ncbi:unnamed protein product [Spirodela intermedia]|uniref:Uncharacterized protein n=2 Tax=Spirodela intermedia TaxID=51605 RepID=A0A7I8JS73_SPIIN|nr:unnamed protein product [Spirodela intermedia]CAA6672605.1 unnamed protein product [Spirodela intermedia]CAA7409827.1 unnamed protein product [Spirodela intermedia]